jgi:hypothetical protein
MNDHFACGIKDVRDAQVLPASNLNSQKSCGGIASQESSSLCRIRP